MEWDDDVRVAVNISPVLIKSDGLPRAVIAALMRSGLKARRLELEVTESIFLEDSGRTNLILSDLQRIGLRLALDDFGTGYSRSEERRVGKGCVSTCRSRWSPYP